MKYILPALMVVGAFTMTPSHAQETSVVSNNSANSALSSQIQTLKTLLQANLNILNNKITDIETQLSDMNSKIDANTSTIATNKTEIDTVKKAGSNIPCNSSYTASKTSHTKGYTFTSSTTFHCKNGKLEKIVSQGGKYVSSI